MFHRFGLGGEPGTGKTRTVMTMPRPLHVIYADRKGGEEEIVGNEDIGIFVHYVDPTNPRDSAIAIINNKIKPAISAGKCASVAYDSASFGQDQQIAKDTSHNRNSMDMQKWGRSGNHVMDVLDVLYQLNAHVIVTFHIKAEPIKNGKEVVGKLWKPAVMPMIALRIHKESGLIGYAWKIESSNGTRTFGTNFLEEMVKPKGVTRFDCTKSPGWGARETPNASAWIERLAKEANERRLKAREELLKGGPAAPAPEPPADAPSTAGEPRDETENTKNEEALP